MAQNPFPGQEMRRIEMQRLQNIVQDNDTPHSLPPVICSPSFLTRSWIRSQRPVSLFRESLTRLTMVGGTPKFQMFSPCWWSLRQASFSPSGNARSISAASCSSFTMKVRAFIYNDWISSRRIASFWACLASRRARERANRSSRLGSDRAAPFWGRIVSTIDVRVKRSSSGSGCWRTRSRRVSLSRLRSNAVCWAICFLL
jgi:hypothetical protein